MFCTGMYVITTVRLSNSLCCVLSGVTKITRIYMHSPFILKFGACDLATLIQLSVHRLDIVPSVAGVILRADMLLRFHDVKTEYTFQ